jgi:NTE family protein/lysophospholipid hydrolase
MNIELDRITSIFRGIDPVSLRETQQAATEVTFDQGEAIFRQGEPGDAVYIVVSGRLEVAAETSGRRYRLETVEPGGWAGEMSLVHSGPRSASVFALTNSRTVRLPADVCRRLMSVDSIADRQLTDAVFRRLPSHHLRSMALFSGLDSDALTSLDHLFEWVCVPGGETLCRQGDPTDAVFIVIDGSLEVLAETEGAERLVSILERGEAIGEVGALSGEPRSATIRAARDSDLIRIERDQFLRLLNEQPQIAVNFARMLASRLRRVTLTPRLMPTVRSVSIISANASPIPDGFVNGLVSAFDRLQRHTRRIGSRDVDAELGPGVASAQPNTDAQRQLNNWLDAQQASHSVIIYECDGQPSPWTLRALRQSHSIIMVARGEERPEPGPLDDALAQTANLSRIRRELVLLHGSSSPAGTYRWLEFRSPTKHHHLRAGHAADFNRLARSIVGASIGVALSGGGARGFAHIGVLKALQERDIPIDVIGGTSMGSVLAAQVAMGWDVPTMIERNRKGFLECAVFSDLTFPYIALMKGKSTGQLLRGMFGDIQIEDLWLPYFCVSTNLSRAQLVVHERGPLWLWVRSSSSVPGVGPPIPWNGDLLVDGGLLNNLPVDVLRTRCAGPLIASDVSPSVDLRTEVETCAEMSGWPYLRRALGPWVKPANFPNLFEILLRCTGMSSDQSLAQTKRTADLYLHPDVTAIGSLDFAAIERTVDIGYRYACERLDTWTHKQPATPARTGAG